MICSLIIMINRNSHMFIKHFSIDQDSVDSVHSLLGRQDELEGLLKALDQRVDHFAERSNKLVSQRHYAAKQ